MGMKYKLLLLDIDGTLVDSKQDALPSATVVAAVKAAQQHLQVAVATGRPQGLAQPVIDALSLHGYGIFNGGAEIIDTSSGETLSNQWLEPDIMRELTSIALPFGYAVYTADSQYETPLSSPDDIYQASPKLFIEAVKTPDAIAMVEELNGVDGAMAHPTTSWIDGDVVDIHITHAQATKQHGAEKLAGILGVQKDEIIAIGDGHNDVPLMEAAELKIAMGNAPDEVKAIADHVTVALADDGVAAAINRFILR